MGSIMRKLRVQAMTLEEQKARANRRASRPGGRAPMGIAGGVKKLLNEQAVDERDQASRLTAEPILKTRAEAKRHRRAAHSNLPRTTDVKLAPHREGKHTLRGTDAWGREKPKP